MKYQKIIVTEQTRDRFHELALVLGYSEEWWQKWCDENMELVKSWEEYEGAELKTIKEAPNGTGAND